MDKREAGCGPIAAPVLAFMDLVKEVMRSQAREREKEESEGLRLIFKCIETGLSRLGESYGVREEAGSIKRSVDENLRSLLEEGYFRRTLAR